MILLAVTVFLSDSRKEYASLEYRDNTLLIDILINNAKAKCESYGMLCSLSCHIQEENK